MDTDIENIITGIFLRFNQALHRQNRDKLELFYQQGVPFGNLTVPELPAYVKMNQRLHHKKKAKKAKIFKDSLTGIVFPAGTSQEDLDYCNDALDKIEDRVFEEMDKEHVDSEDEEDSVADSVEEELSTSLSPGKRNRA